MSRQRSDAAPSQRQLRVGEQIRHLLAEHLMRGDLHNRHLESVSVTVSEVRMSRDLRHAQVFVAELGRDAQPATLEALGRVAPVLGGRLAREMNLKYAPKLRFEADTSFSHAARIDSLLQEGLASHRQPASPADEAASDPGQRNDP
jgi:ribosome-binding factor A